MNKKGLAMKFSKGFTLIELLIVIIILGVLASSIIGNFFTSLRKGRDARRKGDLEQTQRALEMYYEDKRSYPVTASLTFGGKLCETTQCLATEKVYMQKVPNDPISGKNYEYLSSDGTNYKLFACLENNLQLLPYTSSGYTIATMTSCGGCNDSTGAPVAHCVWGISSSNISP